MAQPNPKERPTLNSILKLINQLPAGDQEKLRTTLNNKTKAERWQLLFNKVQFQSQELPPITDDEIMTDMKTVREELKAERAQGSH